MSTHKRSLFLYIALLCAAVFCQHTGHLAKTASQPFRLTPCRVKVAAISPASDSDSTTQNQQAKRPSRTPETEAPFHLGLLAGLRCDASGLSAASLQQSGRIKLLAASIPMQRLPFDLRV